MKNHSNHLYEKYVKRFLDIVLSGLGLVFLSPLMMIVALLVRIKLGSPVLFSQERPGRGEKIFKLYKYRTMTNQKDQEGDLLPDTERLTAFGKKLRATSLDELPELFNIFVGDMSIVGPRPLLVSYLPYYKSEERKRHLVRPGLTGLAQVSGRNNIEWNQRLQKDVEYIQNITFLGDISIIIKTVIQVLRHSDVSVDTTNEGNLAKIRSQEIQK